MLKIRPPSELKQNSGEETELPSSVPQLETPRAVCRHSRSPALLSAQPSTASGCRQKKKKRNLSQSLPSSTANRCGTPQAASWDAAARNVGLQTQRGALPRRQSESQTEAAAGPGSCGPSGYLSCVSASSSPSVALQGGSPRPCLDSELPAGQVSGLGRQGESCSQRRAH